MEVTLPIVFACALITAIATGLGAIPLAFARLRTSASLLPLGEALAAGLMLAASVLLMHEGIQSPGGRALPLTLVGAAAGWLFIEASVRFLHEREDALSVAGMIGADARRAMLIVGAMTVHSMAEGIGIGVSFEGGADLGILITAALAIHNIPEGLAIALVLVPRGVSTLRAGLWAIFSSLPQPLLAIPAFLAAAAFAPALPAGLGFAGGAMIALCVREMLPESLAAAGRSSVFASVAAGMLIMGGLQLML